MLAELTKAVEPLKITDPILDIDGLHLYYGHKEALRNISLAIPRKRVTAFLVITDSVDLARHRSSSHKPVNSPANYRRSACH